MSRHRIVRSMNYSDEYDGYEDVYGHSVEDDYSMSPSDAAFMYDRNSREPARISAFLATEKDIAEEDESDLSIHEKPDEIERRDSCSSIRQHLSDIDEARLRSCLDEVRNVIGDSFSENTLVDTILRAEFDVTRALDELLSSPQKSRKDESPKPQRIRQPRDKQDEDDNISFTFKNTNISFDEISKKKRVVNGLVNFDGHIPGSLRDHKNTGVNKDFGGSKLKFAKPNDAEILVDVSLEAKIRSGLGSSSGTNNESCVKTQEVCMLNDLDSILPSTPTFSKFHRSAAGTPSLSELYKNHKEYSNLNHSGFLTSETAGSKLSSMLSSSETEITMTSLTNCSKVLGQIIPNDGVCNGLSSLGKLQLKHDELPNDDKIISNEMKSSFSSSSKVAITCFPKTDSEPKTLSLNDLLMKHRTENAISNDCTKKQTNSAKSLTPEDSTKMGSSLSELFLKHKRENDLLPMSNDPKQEADVFRPERSSSLSKLAKRYRSTSQCHEGSPESGSVTSLLELAVRHRNTSISEECVANNTCPNVEALPDQFRALKVNATEDKGLSNSLKLTSSLINNSFDARGFKLDNTSSRFEKSGSNFKKRVNIDLSCALRSPDNEDPPKNTSIVKHSKSIEPVAHEIDCVDNAESRASVITITLDKGFENREQVDVLDLNLLSECSPGEQIVKEPDVINLMKSCSPFGKIVCKEFPVEDNYLCIERVKDDFKSDIIPFTFNTKSQDDMILFYLGRG